VKDAASEVRERLLRWIMVMCSIATVSRRPVFGQSYGSRVVVLVALLFMTVPPFGW
jgi:hypothetical protein